ncbi:MAG TPA: tetratricopeptide repeat protein [Candidatus Dormibacteraeota bacterium]|nr:tetratricopeptide repeat protein [Candidatus Dormibacteraeota bacterium]
MRKLASNALDLVKDRSGDAQVMPLHMLAAGTRLERRYAEALELYEESLDLSRRLKDEHMAAAELHNLGHVYLHLGRLTDAERAFEDRLRMISTPAGPYDAAMTVLNEAALAHAHGDAAAARTLVDRAVEQLRAAGIELDPDDAFEVDSLRQALRPGGG